jgi:hypothetical protein
MRCTWLVTNTRGEAPRPGAATVKMKISVSHVPRVLAHMGVALLCCVCSNCGRQAPEADVTGERDTVDAAPVAVDAPAEAAGEAVTSEFVERLRVSRGVALSLARVRVQRLSATDRTVPRYVWPEESGSIIVTKATVDVEEVLCGVSVSGIVDLSYVGGRIGRRWLRTSLMTGDLSPGEEYVLVLSNVEGEYFLVGGRHEILRPVREEGRYRDFAGRELVRDTLAGACP